MSAPRASMTCPRCGTTNAEEVLQCTACGEVMLGEPVAGSPPASPEARTSQISRTTPFPAQGDTDYIPRSEITGASGAPLQDSAVRPADGSFALSFGGASSPTGSGHTGELTPHALFAGRYEILALVGEGGMGRVYMALDRELDKVIALKTIRSDAAVGTDAVQRFKQELLLARKITHKNVVRIYDLGEAEGIKFFSMEYIEGLSLKALIRERKRLPAEDAMALSRQILGALEEAHAQGVVHRDLKPQNIMVDQAGVPHLMDFGIARSSEVTGITETGALLGTPDYMSPEQVRGERVGPPSDLFSFGVILYEMLTGDVPYHADTAVAKILKRLTDKPRKPRELNEEVPQHLEDIVLKSMEVDPALRYQTASEILTDLGGSKVTRTKAARPPRAKPSPAAFAAGGAALALLLLVGVFALRKSPPVPQGDVPPTSVHNVAIVPFTNATGSAEFEWMRTGLPEMLVTDLSQSKFVRPVPGERVSRLLQEAGLGGQTRLDEAALESIAKRAHAQSVLSGQFVESGGRLRLDLTLRKANSGVTVPLKVEASSTEVFAVVDQLSSRLKEQLDLTPEQLKGDTDRPVSEVSTASLEALRAYQSGLAQMRQGANQAAVPLLKQATTVDPKFAMAYAKLAEACLHTGDHEQAESALERARALSETVALPLAERYQIHASAARAKDDYETAAKVYADLQKLYPDDPDVQLNLAQSFERWGKLPEALAAYQAVAKMAPGYGAALLGLGRVQVMSGSPDEAVESLQAALKTGQFKDDAEALGMIHVILGVAYKETSRPEQAIEHLNQSLDYRRKAGLKRGEAATLANLADVYSDQGLYAKSVEAQQKALAIAREIRDREGESSYLSDLGITYKVSGNLDKALAAFRESMQIAMERKDQIGLARLQNHIAEVYRLKGQYDDAIVYLEQAKTHLVQSDEKREKAYNFNYIGLVRRAQGLYEPAIQAFLAALPLFKEIHSDMGVASVQQALAGIYMGQGRFADARTALQESVTIHERTKVEHDLAEAKALLGRLLAAVGRLDEAEKAFQESETVGHGGGHGHGGGGHGGASEGPGPDVLLGRADLAQLRGQRDAAASAYEQANVKANLSGQKEIAVESRVHLGLLYLDQGKVALAERLLERTRQEAAQARLRPLEAEAAAALAAASLAKGAPEPARKAASDAIALADRFSGRPTLARAQVAHGEALDRLGRAAEALDAYAKAAATLDWIRGGLSPEYAKSYLARPDIRGQVQKTVAALEKGGRSSEAAPLKKWMGEASAGSAP